MRDVDTNDKTHSSPKGIHMRALGLSVDSRPMENQSPFQAETFTRLRARVLYGDCRLVEQFSIMIGSGVIRVFVHLGAKQIAVCSTL